MVLEQFNIPASPVTEFLNTLSAQLISVVDQSTPAKPLFNSVGFGLDVVLQSAIDGTPNPEDMPCCRIFYDPHTISYNNSQNTALFQNVPISLYILFNLDWPSAHFQELREDFIRWVLDYLKYNVYGDNRGMSATTWWKWNNPLDIQITHNTQLKFLDHSIPITPSASFSCSRIDLMALVKNYKGPNDRTL